MAILSVMLGTGGMSCTWAQEKPASNELETEGPAEGDESPQATDERPRKRVRPVGPPALTAEQREEAERLKQQAALFGTDPTAIVGRLQFSSQYADLPEGAQFADAVFRVDLPFRKNWLLRTDIPFRMWDDPNQPGRTSAQGLSDLAVTGGLRAYNTPEYAIFIGATSTFPTASETGLGLGKYTVGPFLATARFLPRIQSFLFGVFQHQHSVGGDPSRNDVELTRANARINTIWSDRWWTVVEAAWRVDWEREAKSSMALEFEAGRRLVGTFGMFVRPGVGIWGRDLPGAYEWNIEVGVRYMFASF